MALAVSGCASRRAAEVPPAIPPAAAVSPLELGSDESDVDEFDAPVSHPPTAKECTPGPWTPPTELETTQIERAVEIVLTTTGTPSLTLGAAANGKVLWAKGFGWADVARRRKATPDTPYSMASVSKPMTATALMLLRQRGLVELEKPINDYLPEPGVRAGVGDVDDATVARVASHTAGLPLHYQFFYLDQPGRPPSKDVTRQRYGVLVAAPGETYQYSNLGFGILEDAIAHVSGKSYAQFMQTEVFAPLQMTGSSVGTPPAKAKAAVRYDGARRPIPDYLFDHDGASAIYASVNDLLKFGSLHAGVVWPGATETLDADSRARMRQVPAPSQHYGVGIGVTHGDSRLRVSHSGGMPGVATALYAYPDDGLVLAVAANSSAIGGQHQRLAGALLDVLGLPYQAAALCALPADDPWFGHWEGTVETDEGTQPIALDIGHDGQVALAIGEGAPPRTVRQIQVDDDVLRGDVGLIAGPAALELRLRRRGSTLRGGISTLTPNVSAVTRFATLTRQD